jgi:hypothetical protein
MSSAAQSVLVGPVGTGIGPSPTPPSAFGEIPHLDGLSPDAEALGAGGAGAAVAHALLTPGTRRLTVVDVDADRAGGLTGAPREGSGGLVAGPDPDVRVG